MITYNDLYQALRDERYSEQLKPLKKGFIQEAADYFKEKESMANKDDNLFSENIKKTKKQLENAVSIFKELMLRRKKKLLELAFVSVETGVSKRDFENMLPSEKELFDKLMRALTDGDKEIERLLAGEAEENGEKNKLILFKKQTEEFMDLEGNKLGPFNEGDIVNLPQEIANILIVDNKAEAVDEG